MVNTVLVVIIQVRLSRPADGPLLLAGHLAGQHARVATRMAGEPSDPAAHARAVMHRQPVTASKILIRRGS